MIEDSVRAHAVRIVVLGSLGDAIEVAFTPVSATCFFAFLKY